REAGAARHECALGSVKSLIGHTKCAAGLMGLINASLSLYHDVLPPTIGVQEPNARIELDSSPFRISTRTRPWIHAVRDRPRRAGVSAFGFGGTNFHAVLEAYEGSPAEPSPVLREWPAELLAWHTANRTRLDAELNALEIALSRGSAEVPLRDLALTLARALPQNRHAGGCSLAIVAESTSDLRDKLARARRALAEGQLAYHDPRGVDFAQHKHDERPTVAFLFPGQGAQALDMLGELAVTFPEVRRGFEAVDEALLGAGLAPVAPRVFPPPAFREDEREQQRAELGDTQVAQPALAAACVGLLRQLSALGVTPDVAGGHSFGELVALHAAAAFPTSTLALLAEGRGRLLKEAAGAHAGAMAAVAAGPVQAHGLLQGIEGVWPVNDNGPRQTVVSGTVAAVEQVLRNARDRGVRAQRLAVSAAFHSPIVGAACAPLAELASRLGVGQPRFPVYSNVTAAPHDGNIAERLGQHLAQPVRFAEMVAAMYDAGARVFVEVGPGNTLTSLVGTILGARPHLAVACDPPSRAGVPGLLHALGRLFVAGVPVRIADLAEKRGMLLEPGRFVRRVEAPTATTWLVNGTRAKPIGAPEPPRLGPGPALPPAASIGAPPTPRKAAADRQPGRVTRLPENESGAVFQAFQKTMSSFLDLQREAMLAFLGNEAAPTAEGPGKPPPGANSERSSHPRLGRRQPLPPERNGHGVISREESRTSEGATPRTNPRENGNGAAPARPVANKPALADRLLNIVRERTGYPAEMLGLDLDLEADLGIDSIKRVEILGSLREATGELGDAFDSALMDQLARETTLGGIVRRVAKALPSVPSENGHANGDGKASDAPARHGGPVARAEAPNSPVRRLTLKLVEAPLACPFRPSGLMRGGVVVVTEEGRGIARAIAFDLRARGHEVVRVQHGSGIGAAADGDIEVVDLSSPSAVGGLAQRLRTRGPIAGLVHTLPLARPQEAGFDLSAWNERMGPELRGLFLLTRELADDLERAAQHGGACLIAATALGGAFASIGPVPCTFFPGHGGIAGLVKTLAHEWPGVRTRVVDFDVSGSVEVVAANLVQEVYADDRYSEIGYQQGKRWRLAVQEVALGPAGNAGVGLAPGEPVLVTGGARGITAAVAADLARVWRPTLLLVGTTPLPPGVEEPGTAGIVDPAELKGHLLGRLSQQGRKPGPAELERAYQSLRREREIRENLQRIRALGATVEYASVDVRDAAALGRQIDTWRQRFGPIAGFVHGAGVIQDKLLRDKTPESFDRVLGTKLEGALTLARLLDGEPLKFAAFFSSVAGRFGNKGQSDYAAANEALNKLAIWLDRRWEARVVSLIWGPWSGVGMVSDLEAHLGRQGLGMIPPEEGRSRLSEELQRGRKGDVEVVIASDLGALAQPPEALPAAHGSNRRAKELAR
ncbi:MAG: SDR family NAD(P)-dependent oxidoreductase, partial [Isosphaeraceae bacterium]|nr:SDR family NAD(P)-dependent oxidoreductase [Isosphaeraceae bacterium]